MDVLLFVEDPGAANFIEDLPAKLQSLSLDVRLIAVNHAADHLITRHIAFDPIRNSDNPETIIKRYRPRLIVVGTSQNPNSIGLKLIDCGRRNGTTTVAVIDSSADADIRFSGLTDQPLFYAPDWLVVPDSITSSKYVELGYPRTSIVTVNNPNYERMIKLRREFEKRGLQEIRRSVLPGSGGKPIVVFVDEHSNAGDKRLFKSIEYTFDGRIGLHNRNEVMVGELLDALYDLRIDPYFVVRLHPKSDKSDYKNLVREIDHFSHDSDPYQVVYSADLVFGMTSMLLMESLLLGKNVVAAIPRPEEIDWVPPSLLERVDYVTNADGLKLQLKEKLIDSATNVAVPKPESTYRQQHNIALEKFLMSKIR